MSDLGNIAEEVQELEKSVEMNLHKSIDFDIKGSVLKAGAEKKIAVERAKKAGYKKEIELLGGEVSTDDDDYPIIDFGSQDQANERKVENLNWKIQSCDRKIKTCERIIEHCKDNKTYKLNEYEMEDYGL